jgi:hypothetical protein
MKKKRSNVSVQAVLIFVAALTVAYASDPSAIYARIDTVVLEPSADRPERIQIWGVFSMAKPNDPNDYLPPVRGYLYFELAKDQEAARKEWADLKQVAGSGQIVSIGSRFQLTARIRKASDRPEHADPYIVSMGLTKIRTTTDYSPVRELRDYKD